ncbi:hypothetical protein [Treponema vincentii]|uniref:hypothetical protein n=1 Tax=Treponema vincentii TaxID=69710 RepID=UPI002ED94444
MDTKGDFTKGPGGAPGIEERVRIIFSEGVQKKRISLERFVQVMAANPARIFGMYPQKRLPFARRRCRHYDYQSECRRSADKEEPEKRLRLLHL